MSARRSAPSAMATARWVSTTPGSWVCQEIPQSSMATDMASVNPLRSANSAKSAAPAWRHRITVGYHFGATDRATTVHFQGALLLVDYPAVVTTILPGRRAFYRHAHHCSVVGRILEASHLGTSDRRRILGT